MNRSHWDHQCRERDDNNESPHNYRASSACRIWERRSNSLRESRRSSAVNSDVSACLKARALGSGDCVFEAVRISADALGWNSTMESPPNSFISDTLAGELANSNRLPQISTSVSTRFSPNATDSSTWICFVRPSG